MSLFMPLGTLILIAGAAALMVLLFLFALAALIWFWLTYGDDDADDWVDYAAPDPRLVEQARYPESDWQQQRGV